MQTIDIPARTVLRAVVIVLLSLALASVLAAVVYDVRQTLRWLAAAVFLALALAPAVGAVQRIRVRGHHPPRWLASALVFVAGFFVLVVLVLEVIPPLVTEVEQLGSTAPGYVHDFERWAEDNDSFRELNQKYDLTKTLNEQTSQLPSRLGDAANELRVVTVGLLRNALGGITVLVLAFFLLLEGRPLLDRGLGTLAPRHAETGERIAQRIYGIVRGYVTINLLLATAAGAFTWLVLTLLGVEVAVPLAILVALFDLVPLIGLTIGGLLVAIVVTIDAGPSGLIIWLVAFLAYQQIQDRAVQPMLYGRAVQINPLIAIVALLAGAQILGILGALIAIPLAASIGAVVGELRERGYGRGPDEEQASRREPGPEPTSA
jgi:predicted PurR-regulated permease PerM